MAVCANAKANLVITKCEQFATKRIWSPTWVSAHEGPIHFCDACAENFDETKNERAKDGHFFYDDQADQEFLAVEQFIPSTDQRYESTKTMLGNFPSLFSKVVVLDGKVWVVSFKLITRLGDYFEIKAKMPKLFTEKYQIPHANSTQN